MSTRVIYKGCFYNVPDEYDKVPYGRYSGQPLSVLLDDLGYVRWLLEKGFHREYPELIKALQTGQPVDRVEWLRNHPMERANCKSKVKVPKWMLDLHELGIL